MEKDREIKGQIVSNQVADNKGKFEYHVVQIDLEETKESKAKRDGTYHARFWIRNFKDLETKKVRHCRFYPLVRELLKGGWPGAMIMVGPTQVEKFLDKNEEKYFWYQMSICWITFSQDRSISCETRCGQYQTRYGTH